MVFSYFGLVFNNQVCILPSNMSLGTSSVKDALVVIGNLHSLCSGHVAIQILEASHSLFICRSSYAVSPSRLLCCSYPAVVHSGSTHLRCVADSVISLLASVCSHCLLVTFTFVARPSLADPSITCSFYLFRQIITQRLKPFAYPASSTFTFTCPLV